MNAELLLDLIDRSPTPFHAVATAKDLLAQAGYAPVPTDGTPYGAGCWYAERNGSALIAFRIPEKVNPATVSFRISAAHGDSPCFRLKPNHQLQGTYSRLNTEVYGGSIYHTWTDVPLALAGRVTVREETGLVSRLVHLNRPVAVIPNTAPHLRPMNSGLELNPASDLIPLFGASGDILYQVAAELGVERDAIVGQDLSLVSYGKGFVFGPEGEYIFSPRLDDLECVFTCLDGLLSSKSPENVISLFALFDNEETGSLSYAGAASTLMRDVLARILPDEGQRQDALARSFFVSADNGHAIHPNHPELSDGKNAPALNGGVVLKYNASLRYVSDGFTGALFGEICRRADVPVQIFANRSDKPGGSTLGRLSEAQVPLLGIDIGAAQLAMHSARETAGSRDVEYLSRAMTAFYSENFTLSADGVQWN